MPVTTALYLDAPNLKSVYGSKTAGGHISFATLRPFNPAILIQFNAAAVIHCVRADKLRACQQRNGSTQAGFLALGDSANYCN
jgi:hypothetical protein